VTRTGTTQPPRRRLRRSEPEMPSDLPHRVPFVLLDRIVERVPGQRAVAHRLVPTADPLVRDDGSLLEVLLIEAMAQCAGMAAARDANETAGALVAIDKFDAHVRVGPGDRLVVEALVTRRMGTMVRARTFVHVADQLCAEAELTLRMGPPPRRPA